MSASADLEIRRNNALIERAEGLAVGFQHLAEALRHSVVDIRLDACNRACCVLDTILRDAGYYFAEPIAEQQKEQHGNDQDTVVR